MYRKESRILVSMITTILVFGIYALYVWFSRIQGNPELVNDLQFWGKTILILIPIMVVAQIIIHILFYILNKIITNEEIPTISDEMDRMIELKAIRISHWLFGVGFLLAMGSQAIGMEPWVLFVTLIGSCFVSGIIEEAAKIYLYRKGL